MTLDALYEGLNLQDYYLGKVTQVYRSSCIAQIENIDAMNDRSKFNSTYLPNTINYFVLVDSTVGVFLGEVFENKSSRKNVSEQADGKAQDTAGACRGDHTAGRLDTGFSLWYAFVA